MENSMSKDEFDKILNLHRDIATQILNKLEGKTGESQNNVKRLYDIFLKVDSHNLFPDWYNEPSIFEKKLIQRRSRWTKMACELSWIVELVYRGASLEEACEYIDHPDNWMLFEKVSELHKREPEMELKIDVQQLMRNARIKETKWLNENMYKENENMSLFTMKLADRLDQEEEEFWKKQFDLM